MSIRHFIKELDKGLASPIYFLYSADPYLLKEAVLMLKNTVPASEQGFSFNSFDMESDKAPAVKDILDALNTIPFFGSKRYVVVENFQRLNAKDFKKFEPYMANPSPFTLLLILYHGPLKKESRDNLKGIKTISLDIREQDMPLWVKEKAKQKGLLITDEGVDYLIGLTGPDAGLLSSEIEKLSLVGNSRIGTAEIKDFVEGKKDFNVFDLVEALKKKDSDLVFKIYRLLIETEEPYNLLGALNWQYKKMLGYSKDGLSRKNNFYKIFALLNEADISIKSSGGVFPLEHLLIRLLQI